MTRRVLYHTPFDLIRRKDLIKSIIDGYNSERFEYVVTPNVDHAIRCYEKEEVRKLYRNAKNSVCDSQVLKKLARLKSVDIPEVITGSDLTKCIFENYTGCFSNLIVVGCEEHVIEKLKKNYDIYSIDHINPPMGFYHDHEELVRCCEFIESKKNSLVFFAVGSPQQEVLANLLKERELCGGVGLCIGASLLFLTGDEKRAPRLFSSLSLEWLYRLMQNPRRLWKRYLKGFKIFSIYCRR